jgi:hypothetical protein
MKLGEFIEKYIEHNSLVRLLYKEKGGHRIVLEDWNDVSMEHEILKGKGKYSDFINNEVIGIASILIDGPYSESINIVIKELEKPYKIKYKIDKINERKRITQDVR